MYTVVYSMQRVVRYLFIVRRSGEGKIDQKTKEFARASGNRMGWNGEMEIPKTKHICLPFL